MTVHSNAIRLAMSIVLVLGIGCSTQISPTQLLAPPSFSPTTTQSRRPPTPTVQPSTPSPEAALKLDRLTWRTFSEPFSGPNYDVSGLFINGRSELVAWGYFQTAGNAAETGTSFWTSADGISWRHDLLGQLEDGLHVIDVANGPHGFAAVGFASLTPAAWWSDDGVSWNASTINPRPVPEGGVFRAVAGSDDGFLAVGQLSDEEGRAAAWFSPTGQEWTSVGVGFPTGWFEDVTAASDGGYVVLGVDLSEGKSKATAWHVSRDGRDWQQAEHSDAIGGPGEDHPYYVQSYAGGYIAFGLHADPGDTVSCKGCYWDPELWRSYTSPDGINWNRNRPGGGAPLTPLFPWDGAVEPWADGLLAVGRATDRTRRVWLSADGVDWTPVGDRVALAAPTGDSADVADLLVADNYLVIGGSTGEGGFVMIGTSSP